MDIVLSHTVPIEAEPVWAFIPGLDQSAVDKSTEKWLQKIYDRLDFTEWYAGHYHVESEEFMLGTLNAKIYNIDKDDYSICEWYELENVRYFYDFFKKHEKEFE